MHIRRNSRLNCFNSVAVGFPIGIILDNQKGDTQGSATKGLLSLKNIWLAGMDIVGSDANKVFEDVLVTGYDSKSKPITDATEKSRSEEHTSELQSRQYLVCRLLLEKKNT